MTKSRSHLTSFEASVGHLAEMFARNGCLRLPDPRRRKLEGRRYHAGYEVRVAAIDDAESKLLRACLRTVGLRVGRGFAKGTGFVFPIYGKSQVERFCNLVKGSLDGGVAARKLRT